MLIAGSMKPRENDTVIVEYTGTLDDGTLFSKENESFEFSLGKGQVIPAFEQAVLTLAVGETTKIVIASKDAYGEYKETLAKTPPVTLKAESMGLEVGQVLHLENKENGQRVRATIHKVEGDQVYLDFNHPLAGKTLHFTITLKKIV